MFRGGGGVVGISLERLEGGFIDRPTMTNTDNCVHSHRRGSRV